MPGRFTPPMPDRLAPQWAISALTSVPVACPAAGCTTSPAGLSMTMISSSSNTTLSGIASPAGSAASGSGTFTTITSPALTRWLGSRTVRPPTATSPSRISDFSRVRDSSERSASTRSSRPPASLPETSISCFCLPEEDDIRADMVMPDHSADDEKPLSPEQQKIVDKARWLMLVSGFATFLGIAVVIGVVG